MKLKIERDILLANLNYVSKAISSRNIIPVLNGIKFELKKEGLYLTASDTEITIKALIDKKDILSTEETGELIIYGRILLDLIRKLPSTIIEIEEVDGNKAIISTTTSKYNLNCLEKKDFPAVKIEEIENPIKLISGNFKEIVNQTLFASATSESRPILTGINLKIVGDLLECIATDSYRLSKKIVKISTSIADNINIVIPSRNVSELIKVIEEDEVDVELHIFSNKIVFKYKNLYFQSSLLNGSYPNTDNLIPKEFDYEIKVTLNELVSVIDRASLLTQVKEKNIIQMEVKNKKILITSQSLEIGKIEETMEALDFKGESIKISFSSKYMMDALKTLKEEEITLYLNGEVKPIIIKEKENSELIQLILPIKTY